MVNDKYKKIMNELINSNPLDVGQSMVTVRILSQPWDAGQGYSIIGKKEGFSGLGLPRVGSGCEKKG